MTSMAKTLDFEAFEFFFFAEHSLTSTTLTKAYLVSKSTYLPT